MEKKCDHILGQEDGVDEDWLVFSSEGWHSNYKDSFNVVFRYCPLCGEELQID